MASAQLSRHDQAVLNCVFNPLLPLHEAFDEKPKLELKGNAYFMCVVMILINLCK